MDDVAAGYQSGWQMSTNAAMPRGKVRRIDMSVKIDVHTLNLIKMMHLECMVENWCRNHPAYHAMHAPKTDCPECKRLWQHRLKLNQINELIEEELKENPITADS